VSRRRWLPLLSTTQIPWSAAGAATEKTICLPPGDQLGVASKVRFVYVRRRSRLPFAFMVQTSGCLSARMKTSRFPLCEYDGAKLPNLRLEVSRRRCVPFAVLV
jgi:hypothetical protein